MLKRLLFLTLTAAALSLNLCGADAQQAANGNEAQADYSLLDQPTAQEEQATNEQAVQDAVVEPTDIVQPIEEAPDADAGI